MIVVTNKDLLNLNTFKVQAIASKYIQINKYEELLSSSLKNELRSPFYLIGAASNILFVSNVIDKIVTINTKGIIANKYTDYILIKAQAGELLSDVVKFCVDNNYGGMENLALIPGKIGAAPVQNVGAYGLEVKDIFYQLEALNTKTFKLEHFSLSDCDFAYRNSIFKKNPGLYIISSVTFKLNTNYRPIVHYASIREYLESVNISSPTMKDIYNAVCNIRLSKLPNVNLVGNAGSFFKNPIVNKDVLDKALTIHSELNYTQYGEKFKLSAASLIELSGLKGIEKNGVSLWQKQPLVVINRGNLSGNDIFSFAKNIMDRVYKKFGIILEIEVNII